MTRQVDFDYYDWLVSQIEVRNQNTYSYVFERLHNLEFVWTLDAPHDENRVQDCRDLRAEFLDGRRKALSLEGATLLELLIVLARTMEFTAGGRANEWAWKLLKNLRLTKVPDPVSDDEAQRIDDILDALVWRTYDPDGHGGFFPLKEAKEDQTKVELWYQLNAYVIEMGVP